MEDQYNLPHNQVFSPYNLAELFQFWNRFPDAVLCSGGTDLLRRQRNRIFALPQNLISLDKVEELQKINRTERHLEIGAAICLSDIPRIGKIVPEPLVAIINSIGNPRLRNLASIGGAIMSSHRYSDIHSILIAQDATYELKSASNSRWISASKFVVSGPQLLQEEQALISRIRIPLTQWTYMFHKKIGNINRDDPNGGTFLLLCSIEKDIITDLRIIFVGSIILRFKDMETHLVGQSIPLDEKIADTLIYEYSSFITEKILDNNYLQHSIIRSMKASLYNIV
ncbi:FAD binding domain-containing protein [Gracilinema caldarium]|uniref:Molybdopterin dehydrogenase FAD-binding protein n=1 Tax=Gracilinema caldarium (strain ATCC 51460 / DSM 7334 / H1) TaxID=744872 RepID=F8EXL5_GRAC1|nr:FAD binding domain-containing protein [Gracilinema caldarium]AEJ19596.1 molybdopterin dehydrogenase FAD-binding protein [Gracilinema caldarium DSM 7334]